MIRRNVEELVIQVLIGTCGGLCCGWCSLLLLDDFRKGSITKSTDSVDEFYRSKQNRLQKWILFLCSLNMTLVRVTYIIVFAVVVCPSNSMIVL